MDNDLTGDRFVPLPNGPKYGPKRWRQDPDWAGPGRRWIEIEMTQSEKDFDRMESMLFYSDPACPATRTDPITLADIDRHNLPPEYLDGHGVFPAPMFYPTGKGPEAEAERVKTEAIWESHYAAMEALQTIIRPPDKPEDAAGTGRYFQELRRGD